MPITAVVCALILLLIATGIFAFIAFIGLVFAVLWLWLSWRVIDGPEPPPPPPVEKAELVLSEDQKKVLECSKGAEWDSAAILITGAAGTGKSTLLREIQSRLEGQHVVVAPTGLAAVNVGGQTIHSFFGFPPRLLRYECDEDLGKRYSAVLKQLEYLIIDEISMVRVDVMDAIDRHLRRIRANDLPFGGVRLIMFGDTMQLEPVVVEGEAEYIQDTWGSPFFFDAHVWRRASFRAFILEQVHRQASDAEYARVLHNIRVGQQEAIGLLNQLALVTGRPPDDSVVLTPRRRAADELNRQRLANLPGPARIYTGRTEGCFPTDWLPTEMHLELKPEARVMVLRNTGKCVNGDLGTVRSMHADRVTVVLQRTGNAVDVEPVSWENIRYEYEEETRTIEPKVIGRFWQLPLRLAWALTIHKAQGLTLEKVHVDFDKGMFAHGQAYVAVSRCRHRSGLSLSRHLNRTDLIWHERALEFAEYLSRHDIWHIQA